MLEHKKLLNIDSKYNIIRNFKFYEKNFYKNNKRKNKKTLRVFKNYFFKYKYLKNLFLDTFLKRKKRTKLDNIIENINNNYKFLKVSKMLKKYKYYILTIKTFYSNFYITLSTNKNKLILTYSTGQFVKSNMKKKKLSLLTVLKMLRKVIKYLKKKKVKYICVHLRTHINNFIFNIFHVLNLNKIKFIYLLFNKPIPHHFGQRKKKTRRL